MSNKDILNKTKLKNISKGSNFDLDTRRETESGSPKNNLVKTEEKERQYLWLNTWTEAKQVAKDRKNWRRSTAALWATGPKEYKA